MAGSNVFNVNVERQALVVAPTRNISSLAEEEVQAQWEDIKTQVKQPDVKHIVFDFGNVNYFGSSMLEAMLYLWKQVNSDDGRMAVCNVSETASEILKISRFDTLWPICDSKDDALKMVHD